MQVNLLAEAMADLLVKYLPQCCTISSKRRQAVSQLTGRYAYAHLLRTQEAEIGVRIKAGADAYQPLMLMSLQRMQTCWLR